MLSARVVPRGAQQYLVWPDIRTLARFRLCCAGLVPESGLRRTSARPASAQVVRLVDPFLARFGSSVAEVRQWRGDRGYDLMQYEPELNRFIGHGLRRLRRD